MLKEEREIIEEPIHIYAELSDIFDNNNIQKIIQNILDIETKLKDHPKVVNNPEIYFDFKVRYNSPYEGYDQLDFVALRYETDKELADRIEKNKKILEAKKESDKKKKETQEKKERSTLATLKKKYESK